VIESYNLTSHRRQKPRDWEHEEMEISGKFGGCPKGLAII
jgi:hypothetical protein